MTFGSLFAGIGGFDLGFERAGMKCVWQVEKDEYARKVLAKHWPGVRRWDDVCTFPPEPAADWSCDVICGGFPCQDVSLAKSEAKGIEGDRSRLWFEYERILRDIRPDFIVVENVPGLFVRGFGRVLGSLASLGYDAEWSVISACSFGAPHTRERVFILGYSKKVSPWRLTRQGKARRRMPVSGSRPLESRSHWAIEPDVARVAYGIPSGMDRLGATGNAVVPQIAEWIGRRIMEALP